MPLAVLTTVFDGGSLASLTDATVLREVKTPIPESSMALGRLLVGTPEKPWLSPIRCQLVWSPQSGLGYWVESQCGFKREWDTIPDQI